MKSLKTQLSELPNSKSEFIKRTSLIKKEMDYLMVNAIRKDEGKDLKKFLEPFDQRFDVYMASVIRKCGTSLCFHDKKLDEYFIINKDEECVNITKLVNDYERLPISEWLFRFSTYFFETIYTSRKKVQWGFSPNESTFNEVAMLFMEGAKIAENKGYDYTNSYMFFVNSSMNGEYEPIESFQPSENDKQLNELHIIMAELNDILLKYPFEISGSPFKNDLKIKIGFGKEINLFEAYENYKKSSETNPLLTMKMLERDVNEYLTSQLIS